MTRPRVRWTIFAVAFGIRVVAISWSGPDLVEFGDAQDYLATASHVCSEHAYPDRTGLPFFRAPLLPFFIAATTLCHTERIILIKLALAACDAATALVISFGRFVVAERRAPFSPAQDSLSRLWRVPRGSPHWRSAAWRFSTLKRREGRVGRRLPRSLQARLSSCCHGSCATCFATTS